MSIQALQWAMYDAPTNHMPAGAFRVLLVLADHAHNDGTCAFPKPASIAERIGVSLRTVRRHLAMLRDAGLIIEGDQRHVDHLPGNYRPTVYDLALWIRGDSNVTPADVTPTVTPTSPGVTETAPRGDRTDRPGVTPAGRHRNRNRTKEPTRARQPRPALCPRCNSDHDLTASACPPVGPPPRPLAQLVAEVGQRP